MKSAHRQASRAKRRYAPDPTAHLRVIGRAQPFTESERVSLNLPVRLAFDSMRKGEGSDEDFHTLAGAINIAMVCSESIDQLVEVACIAARDALMRMHGRFQKLQRWGLDGQGMQELETAIEVYEQLTEKLTAGQIQDALQECFRRMRAGEVAQ